MWTLRQFLFLALIAKVTACSILLPIITVVLITNEKDVVMQLSVDDVHYMLVFDDVVSSEDTLCGRIYTDSSLSGTKCDSSDDADVTNWELQWY